MGESPLSLYGELAGDRGAERNKDSTPEERPSLNLSILKKKSTGKGKVVKPEKRKVDAKDCGTNPTGSLNVVILGHQNFVAHGKYTGVTKMGEKSLLNVMIGINSGRS